VSIANPAAATTSPHAIRDAGLTRLTSGGVRLEPAMNASDHGSVHSPAMNGDRPSTSWRYCGRKRKPPNITRIVRPYAASDALKPDSRKRRRSTSGVSSRN
jgi:hypothetical protein